MNDLHTPELTLALAADADATALINFGQDRNEVDLNRISDTHEQAPAFLERLLALLEDKLARHERVALFTVHGWNVVQAAVDVGLGCTPGPDPFAVPRGAAVSEDFASGLVRAFVAACAERGIGATIGARYPARARENLLQLFTGRYREDARALVRALAALSPRVDAVQLELGIALRWPGPWRERLLDAWRSTLGAPPPSRAMPAAIPEARPARAHRLQFVSPTMSGLAGLDGGAGGGRLLLFPPGGGLVLFTGERTGGEKEGAVGPLVMRGTGGAIELSFAGPILHFPDTTPFLDLETGLARAHLGEATVSLVFTPAHPPAGNGDFGRVDGRVTLDGERFSLTGPAYAEEGTGPGPWPRLRVAFQLDPSTAVAVTVGLADGHASGYVCRNGTHDAVTVARSALGPPDAPLARFGLELELASGERVALEIHATHSLPVIRGGTAPIRLEFAACRLAGSEPGDGSPVGWCELGGL
jgi:hypothetical protein